MLMKIEKGKPISNNQILDNNYRSNHGKEIKSNRYDAYLEMVS